MKLSIPNINIALGIIFVFASDGPSLSNAFTVNNSRSSSTSSTQHQPISLSDTFLKVASLDPQAKPSNTRSSSIDDELSSLAFAINTKDEGIHSILDDGEGHINSDLARSIWQWENTQLTSTSSQTGSVNDLYPAKRLKYSTRDGLRLVEDIAQVLNDNGRGTKERFADLVQEGVVALMKCTVLWDEQQNQQDSSEAEILAFETFARGHIETAMKQAKNKLRDDVSSDLRIKLNLEMQEMQKKREQVDQTKAVNSKGMSNQSASTRTTHDRIVQPMREAINDENATPVELALSDMIRHDIGEFLERQLSETELKIIRLRFGLEENVQRETVEIARALGLEISVALEMEREALRKLRISFEDDYIGAYLDDDHETEVSL
jgi:DNA-directed RNA polymerase sigma subunit (sigma70/sigma32)